MAFCDAANGESVEVITRHRRSFYGEKGVAVLLEKTVFVSKRGTRSVIRAWTRAARKSLGTSLLSCYSSQYTTLAGNKNV
ncbi:hypothetical protein J6590_006729 [Homalodisca vitripennis]|nr:hypothetical protein J6590_006729 [Homalodisca vitripennis]